MLKLVDVGINEKILNFIEELFFRRFKYFKKKIKLKLILI